MTGAGRALLRLTETNLESGSLAAAQRCLASLRASEHDPTIEAEIRTLARRLHTAAQAAGDAALTAQALALLGEAPGAPSAVTPGLPSGASGSGTLDVVRRLLVSPALLGELRRVVDGSKGPLALPVGDVLAELIAGEGEVESTARLGLDLVARATRASQAHLVLADEAQTSFGLEGPARAPETSRGILAEVARTHQTVMVDDGLRDPRFAPRESVQALGVGSVLCVPVLASRGRTLLGAIYLEGAAGQFGARERELAETLAALIGPPLFAAKRERDLSSVTDRADRLAAEQARRVPEARLLGTSEALRRLRATIEKVAVGHHPVLIQGESGSGKELVARALHAHSQVAAGVFLPENVGALSEGLAEAELFGHERGAFTGAHTARPGLFRLAQGGTLLLDEVGELSLELQAKLLRVLQEREVRPVGGSASVPVDARVLAATHRDLAAEVRAGRFREDLYFRLSVVTVVVPPLRQRLEDLPLLLEHFLAQAAAEQGQPPPVLTPALVERLSAYSWPGNVRELAAYATRLVLAGPEEAVLGDGRPRASSGGLEVALAHEEGADLLGLREARVVFDKAYLALALERSGSVTSAAEALGLNRSYLSELVKRYGLKRN